MTDINFCETQTGLILANLSLTCIFIGFTLYTRYKTLSENSSIPNAIVNINQPDVANRVDYKMAGSGAIDFSEAGPKRVNCKTPGPKRVDHKMAGSGAIDFSEASPDSGENLPASLEVFSAVGNNTNDNGCSLLERTSYERRPHESSESQSLGSSESRPHESSESRFFPIRLPSIFTKMAGSTFGNFSRSSEFDNTRPDWIDGTSVRNTVEGRLS